MKITEQLSGKINHLKVFMRGVLDAVHDNWLLWKYRSSPYTEYYKAIMKRKVYRDPRGAVGGHWDYMGGLQMRRLLQYGLTPEHSLLDIGCGSLRGGLHFIKFLNEGNYTGIDISKEVLEAGKVFVEENKLGHKKPNLILVNDLSFDYINGRTYDFIHAQSVLSHMPKKDIEECFSNLPKVMNKKSVFLASFFESKKGNYYPRKRKRDFFYPINELQKMAQRHGLNLDNVKDAGKQSQSLMRITLK